VGICKRTAADAAQSSESRFGCGRYPRGSVLARTGYLPRSMCCWEWAIPTARKGRARPSGGSLAGNRPSRRIGVRQTDRDRGPTDLLFGPALRVLPLQHGLHPSDGLPTGRPFSVVVEVVFRHTDGLPRGPPGLPRLFHGSPADTASRCHVYSPASRIRMIPAVRGVSFRARPAATSSASDSRRRGFGAGQSPKSTVRGQRG